MKVFILVLAIFGSVLANNHCKSKYHFWRPFNGTIPEDAFVAATDLDDKRNYIARIIPQMNDNDFSTIPTGIKEGEEHVNFQWQSSKPLLKLDDYVEILCTEHPRKLEWINVKAKPDEVPSSCCLIRGGITYWDRQVCEPFIGKVERNGYNFVGRTFSHKGLPGIYFMENSKATSVDENFEVLTYGCESTTITQNIEIWKGTTVIYSKV